MAGYPYRSWVEVSLQQIAENYRAVRAAVGPGVEVMGVVKTEAYGHGAVEVARTLLALGARWLAVTSVEEGVALREAGIAARILVMADNLPHTRPALLEFDLTPVVHTLADLRELNQLARQAGRRIPFHLKIDTGMGRLGMRAGAAEIAEALREAAHMQLEGLMTHFASAADYSTSQTDQQIQAFDEALGQLRRAGVECACVHASGTNPIAYGRRQAWHNMVRPGLALYGYVSAALGEAPPSILEVKPALTWKASVLVTKEAPEGALIGYGGLFRAPRPMRIAVIGAGYADGVSHRLSNRGQVIAGGRLVRILGAVSMDLTTIDVTECPSIQAGDAVTLLGSEGQARLDAQQIASTTGTISYDVLCQIRARVRRVYV
jgi:alanine racemase